MTLGPYGNVVLMAVIYRRFDGERVSRPWLRLLRDLRAAGVGFHLNEGHRTFARQAELVRQLGVWSLSNRTGAARPSINAPHIRTGRFDHACDFDNAAAVEMAAQRRGVNLTATVPGEPWHLEADRDQLLAYYRRRNREIRRARRKRLLARAKRAAAKLRRRRTSSVGVATIRRFEGCRLEPYNDPAGFATIGVGHLIARRPVNDADRDRYRGFTRADADRLLACDLVPFEKAVRRVPMKLTQAQFDALVSATFNLGPGVLERGRSLGDALHAKDPRKVAAALRLYDKAGSPPRALPGLTRRREAEASAFLNERK